MKYIAFWPFQELANAYAGGEVLFLSLRTNLSFVASSLRGFFGHNFQLARDTTVLGMDRGGMIQPFVNSSPRLIDVLINLSTSNKTSFPLDAWLKSHEVYLWFHRSTVYTWRWLLHRRSKTWQEIRAIKSPWTKISPIRLCNSRGISELSAKKSLDQLSASVVRMSAHVTCRKHSIGLLLTSAMVLISWSWDALLLVASAPANLKYHKACNRARHFSESTHNGWDRKPEYQNSPHRRFKSNPQTQSSSNRKP